MEKRVAVRHTTVSEIGKLISIIENAHAAYKLGSLQYDALKQVITTKVDEVTNILHTNIDMLDPYYVKYIERFCSDQRAGLESTGGTRQPEIHQPIVNFESKPSKPAVLEHARKEPEPQVDLAAAPTVAFQPQVEPASYFQQNIQSQISDSPEDTKSSFSDLLTSLNQENNALTSASMNQFAPEPAIDIPANLQQDDFSAPPTTIYTPNAELEFHEPKLQEEQQETIEQNLKEQDFSTLSYDMDQGDLHEQYHSVENIEQPKSSLYDESTELPTADEIHQRLEELVPSELTSTSHKTDYSLDDEYTEALEKDEFQNPYATNQEEMKTPEDENLYEKNSYVSSEEYEPFHHTRLSSEETLTQNKDTMFSLEPEETLTHSGEDHNAFDLETGTLPNQDHEETQHLHEVYDRMDESINDRMLTLDGTEMVEDEPEKGSPVFDTSFDVGATREFDMQEILEKAQRQNAIQQQKAEQETIKSIPEFGQSSFLTEQHVPIDQIHQNIQAFKNSENEGLAQQPSSQKSSVKDDDDELITGNELIEKIDKFFGLKK